MPIIEYLIEVKEISLCTPTVMHPWHGEEFLYFCIGSIYIRTMQYLLHRVGHSSGLL